MCGIMGYNGKNKAVNILLDGLHHLEYRGYDSSGIALQDENIKIYKAKGKLINLEEKIKNERLNATCGIGHTRWATHGEANENNAHPHTSNDGNIVLVHNGIIENYHELTLKLESHGYKFYSKTDTEVLVNLIDYYYKKYKLGPIDAINRMMVRVKGSYAIAVLFKDYPNQIWVSKKDSPLIIGESKEGVYIASDVAAIYKYTKDIYYVDDLESACINKDKVIFYDLNGDVVNKKTQKIKLDLNVDELNGYEHFMIKEINEQPEVISKTIDSYVFNDKINFSKLNLNKELKEIDNIQIVACGSAYHVGVCAKYIIEDLTRIPVNVDIASEFRYRNPVLSKNSLVIIISQSGETADSLAALRESKSRGVKTLAIVNVASSSIAREADYVLYTSAGREVSVATTKAFTSQLIVCYLLAIQMSFLKGKINEKEYLNYLNELKLLPEKVQYILDNLTNDIKKISSNLCNTHDAFYIGRNLDYAISLEGSLKLKEVSYIHSEAYAAGELKHGTISLIEDDTLVFGIITQDEIYEKTISNLIEVKSRGAYIISITKEGIDTGKFSDYNITIPSTVKYFYPSLSVIPLQLLSYYITISKGLDVDKPRNLAKSVTVE